MKLALKVTSWLFIFCFILLCFFYFTTPIDRAVYYWSIKRGLEPCLVNAIIDHESGRGMWMLHDSRAVLIKQDWVWGMKNDPKYKNVIRWNNPMTFWSFGHMQVLYLVAVEYGFRGDPMELMRPMENVKYGTWILKDFITTYKGNVRHAISAYNMGYVSFNWFGEYCNYNYTESIYWDYKGRGGKWSDE